MWLDWWVDVHSKSIYDIFLYAYLLTMVAVPFGFF